MDDVSPHRIDHVLVPLDGSRLAEVALAPAIDLAKRLGARVTLVHVLERRAPSTVHGERHLTSTEEADRYLERIAADLQSVDIVADYHVHANAQDDVTISIAAHAHELGASLLVLCTHGHGGPRDWISGSVAQRVVRQAPVPVLLVRPSDEAVPRFAPRAVVTALDGTSEGESILPAALTLARAFDAVLRLVLIVPTVSTVIGDRAAAALLSPAATTAALDIEAATAADYIERVASRLGQAGVVVEGNVLRGDAVRSMSELAAREAPSLLAVATHARGALTRFGPRVSVPG